MPDRTLKMVVNTNTDGSKMEKFTLRPRKLTEQSGLKWQSKPTAVKQSLLKWMLENLLLNSAKQMPNGYFLEGFVRFVDPGR